MTWPPTDPVVAPARTDQHRESSDRSGVLRDVLVILGVLAVAGLLAGFAWAQLVDPVVATRTATGVVSPEAQLVKQVDADGWFATLGFGTCLALGIALMLWRRRDPVVTLLAVVVGSLLAAWLCVQLGSVLGPDPAAETLARAAAGKEAPNEITVSAKAAYLAWPLGAGIGCLVVLLGLGNSERQHASSVVQ